VKNIDLGIVPTQWTAPLGASGLLTSVPATNPLGIAMSGAKGTGLCVGGTHALAQRAVPRVRPEVIFPGAKQAAVHNQYATSVDVDGVGASGPPRKRETGLE
jgi:hypothetical protein